QPNARAGLADEAEAKKIIDSLKGSSANVSYDFNQCQDNNCSSGGSLATGDKSCYRGIWIYFVNNKSGAYLKDVLKGYPKGSENNILALASPRSGETAETIARSTVDIMFSFSNLYEMSAQCDESGGQGEFATGDKWYYCGLQTASCGLTSSGYATQAQCEAALQKNRTGDLATTNKCYKLKEKCQNECKRYAYCSTGTATPTCSQTSGVYSSITECEESLKKYFASGQTSGKCFLSTDECAKNCGKYYYCPTSQNETQCVRTSAVYNSEEDCVESLRKYLKDSAGNYLSTNKCYFDRGSCENNCKAQRFWYCNTASGVCDITYSTYKSAELCQNSLATYLPNITKPFVCFPSDQKAACTASCQKTWSICEKAVGQCRPFGQYNTDIECEKALAKMTDAGKYNLKCYSSTDSCKDECGGKRNFYYCPSLEETCIKVPEQFTNKQDCESYLKGKTVEGLTSGQYLRVGLPICFEYDASGMSDCKNQCLKSRPTQFFCVKAALPEMSRCLSTDGRVDYADCVKQITEVFGPSVLPQCWPTLEACDAECKKPSFGVPVENVYSSPLSSPIIKGMKKYYYCNKLAKGVQLTSNVYLSVADCQANLKKYLPGQTTGVCYDNANQAASACSIWSNQSYYYCFTGSGTREVRKTSSQYTNQKSCEENLTKYMPGQTGGQCFTNYANAYSSCSPRFYFCFNGKIVAAENVGSESNCSAVMSRMYGKAVKCMNNLSDAQRNCK
ncbi:MAG TPA: hypothetical protein PKM84_01345, partial [Candidatus Pacearchaeota archaeon]|nr:hypothetical protein [Candidatus Pacearchaeota archaeon]